MVSKVSLVGKVKSGVDLRELTGTLQTRTCGLSLAARICAANERCASVALARYHRDVMQTRQIVGTEKDRLSLAMHISQTAGQRDMVTMLTRHSREPLFSRL